MRTSKVSSRYSLPIVRKRIDDRTEFYPTLDYSFHNAQTIEDVVCNEPRAAPNRIREGDRYHSHGINFNHNMLHGPLLTFPNFVRRLLIDPNALSRLDLSFNTFTEIPSVITQFPSLKYFYFHKNLLSELTEISKLSSLNELKHLTLQGNPIEELHMPYLRSYVLCFLPDLRSLNCTPVSKADLKSSAIWERMNQTFLTKISKK